MSGICSKHRGHDPTCRLCTAMPRPVLTSEETKKLLAVEIEVQTRDGIEADIVPTLRHALRAEEYCAKLLAMLVGMDLRCGHTAWTETRGVPCPACMGHLELRDELSRHVMGK
jgi:hypothetical protein